MLCNLTHQCDDFLVQFIDGVVFNSTTVHLQQLLLFGGRKARIVADLLAILAHILRVFPESAKIVEEIVLGSVEGKKYW